jgi:hypothetical protein
MTQDNGGATPIKRPTSHHARRRTSQTGGADTQIVSGDRRQEVLNAAYDEACRHFTAFTSTKLDSKSGGARWTLEAQIDATSLLRLYFFGTQALPGDGLEGDQLREITQAEIAELEEGLSNRLVREVRRRFTSACYFDQTIQETPGQAQPWFGEVLATTVAFHLSRKTAAEVARRTAAGTTA